MERPREWERLREPSERERAIIFIEELFFFYSFLIVSFFSNHKVKPSLIPMTSEAKSSETTKALLTFDSLEEFEDLVKDAKRAKATLVVCFSTSWCRPCKAIAPFLEEQAEAFKDKPLVRLAKTVLSDDEEEELMEGLVSDYGIRITGVPHFAVIFDGIYDKDASWSGASKDRIVSALERYASPSA